MLPDGPRARPIVNMVKWLRTPLPFLDGLAAHYGHVFTLRLPRLDVPMVIFAEPAAVRDLWTGDPLTLNAGQANVILRAVLGKDSLIVLDGERHLRERRLMLPPFHGERMRAYGHAMRDATAREVDTWPLGRAFSVHASMQTITLDVIMRTIFGVGADDARLAPLRDALVRWTTLGTSRLGTALLLLTPPDRADDVHRLATGRWGRWLPWAPLVRARDETDRLVRELIAARRREDATGREDILSMLLAARDDTGAALTDHQLRDEMLTLLLAGHETTATTLAWALHHLLANPAWLARARAEVLEVAGAGDVQAEQIERLVVLDAVIKETLRLTPIIPMVGRVLGKPTTIGNVDLPAGAIALASIYLVHRRADLWADPTRFDPARFIGKKPDPSTYFPFGGGARRCLGMAFATYEMKIVLATVLARTELAPGSRAPVRIVRRGITLAPSGGTPIVVTARRAAPS
jgi:cytochrome P450